MLHNCIHASCYNIWDYQYIAIYVCSVATFLCIFLIVTYIHVYTHELIAIIIINDYISHSKSIHYGEYVALVIIICSHQICYIHHYINSSTTAIVKVTYTRISLIMISITSYIFNLSPASRSRVSANVPV